MLRLVLVADADSHRAVRADDRCGRPDAGPGHGHDQMHPLFIVVLGGTVAGMVVSAMTHQAPPVQHAHRWSPLALMAGRRTHRSATPPARRAPRRCWSASSCWRFGGSLLPRAAVVSELRARAAAEPRQPGQLLRAVRHDAEPGRPARCDRPRHVPDWCARSSIPACWSSTSRSSIRRWRRACSSGASALRQAAGRSRAAQRRRRGGARRRRHARGQRAGLQRCVPADRGHRPGHAADRADALGVAALPCSRCGPRLRRVPHPPQTLQPGTAAPLTDTVWTSHDRYRSNLQPGFHRPPPSRAATAARLAMAPAANRWTGCRIGRCCSARLRSWRVAWSSMRGDCRLSHRRCRAPRTRW